MRLSVASKIPPDEEDRHDEGNGNDTYGKQEPEDVHALGTLLYAVSREDAGQDVRILDVAQACAIEIGIFYRDVQTVISPLYVALLEQHSRQKAHGVVLLGRRTDVAHCALHKISVLLPGIPKLGIKFRQVETDHCVFVIVLLPSLQVVFQYVDGFLRVSPLAQFGCLCTHIRIRILIRTGQDKPSEVFCPSLVRSVQLGSCSVFGHQRHQQIPFVVELLEQSVVENRHIYAVQQVARFIKKCSQRMHMRLFKLRFSQPFRIVHTLCVENGTVGVSQSRVEPERFVLFVELHTYFVALPVGKMWSRKALAYVAYPCQLLVGYGFALFYKTVQRIVFSGCRYGRAMQ